MKNDSEIKTKTNTSQLITNATKIFSPHQQTHTAYPSYVNYCCFSLEKNKKIRSQSNECPKKVRSKSHEKKKRESPEETYQIDVLNKIKQNANLSLEIKFLAINLLYNGPAVKFEDLRNKNEINYELDYCKEGDIEEFQQNYFSGNIQTVNTSKNEIVGHTKPVPTILGKILKKEKEEKCSNEV